MLWNVAQLCLSGGQMLATGFHKFAGNVVAEGGIEPPTYGL